MIFNLAFVLTSLLDLSAITCSTTNTAETEKTTFSFRSGYSLSREDIKNQFLQRYKSFPPLTREDMKNHFLEHYKSIPDSFDPFNFSLLKALVEDNPVTAPFFDFLFKQPAKMFEFDLKCSGNLKAFFVNNLILFHAKDHNNSSDEIPINRADYQKSIEIIRNVLIPGYRLLNESSVDVIIEALKNNEDIASVMEREAVKNFIKGYEDIINGPNETVNGTLLKHLLLDGRRDANFKSKLGKYYFAFLIQVPYEVLKDLKPEGIDFDDLFCKMTLDAYDIMTKTTSGYNETELILSSILPNVYDKVTDEMSFSEKIKLFIDSERMSIHSFYFRFHDFKSIDPNFEDIESRDFFIKFIQKYLQETKVIQSLDYDALVLYVGIKRMERIYPTFVADYYDQTLKKCIEYINQSSLDTETRNMIGITALNNAFIEIYDLPRYQLSPEVLANKWHPFQGQVYCSRRYAKIADFNLLNDLILNHFIGSFISYSKIKIFDYFCDILDFERENVRIAIVRALTIHVPEGFCDHLFTKNFMFSLNMLKEIISSWYGNQISSEFVERLLKRFIEINEREGAEIEDCIKYRIIESLYTAQNYELLYRVLGGEFKINFNANVLSDYLTYLVKRHHADERFNVMKFVLDKYGLEIGKASFLTALKHKVVYSEALKFFIDNYPQIFDDVKTMAPVLAEASFLQDLEIFDCIYENCKPEIFDEIKGELMRSSLSYICKNFINNYKPRHLS